MIYRELRVVQRRKKRKPNKEWNNNSIIYLYQNIKKNETGRKMTLRAMALAIKNDQKAFILEDQDIKKPPGLTLISEILRNSEEAKREFEKVGGLWIIKM